MDKLRTWKRGGIYYITRDKGSRAHWFSTGLRSYSAVVAKFSNGIPAEQTAKTPRLSEFITILTTRTNGKIRPGTLRSYKLALEQLQELCGNKRIDAIEQQDIERFTRRSGAQAATINVGLRAIRASFNKARRWGLLDKVPTIELLSIARQTPRFLSHDEFLSILAKVTDIRMRDIFTFAFFSGCRLSEVLNLPWDHVDVGRRLILVGPRGNFRTKNDRTRSVPMHREVVALLERRQRERQGEFVFDHSGNRWAPFFVSHQFKKVAVAANIPDAHFHTLRHSFASLLVQSGVPIYSVSKLLGHQSVTVTEIYAHLVPSKLLKDVELLWPVTSE